VCQLLYFIIFVPYNLFKLILVHKISAYKYICENGKKKWERKKKRNSRLTGLGGFRPGWVRAHGVVAKWAHMAHEERGTARRTPWAQAHVPERERRDSVRGGGGERSVAGENRSPVNPTEVPRRWSGSGWTGWWQSTSGGRGSRRWGQFDRWRPRVAGPRRVAGARGGEVAGEATGRNRRQAGVR
jgi:hypothetical protein